MIITQLQFDYGEQYVLEESKNQRVHRNPDKVYPDDITYFLDKYLSEYKEDILSGKLSEGIFSMPKLDAVHNVEPKELVPFNAVMSLSPKDICSFLFFHFFQHDYQFERIWKNPTHYLPFLLRIGQGIGPDFSMYLYMHPAEAIINCCRNRLLTFYLQKQGLTIIPNVCFGDEQTLSWAFDGLPENSILALTSQSCLLDNVAKRSLLNGIHKLVRDKHPELLYVYGLFPDVWKDKFGVEIKTLPTFCSKWSKAE
ncbi:MAG: DUF4417 domain-containing protein [Victivallales bacterium]|nr:DUF4417 domain-containing protein [Victivallales bacterium]